MEGATHIFSAKKIQMIFLIEVNVLLRIKTYKIKIGPYKIKTNYSDTLLQL